MPPPTSDVLLTDLIERLATGDDAALRPLYDQCSRRLYGLALRIVRQPETAEDVLQEAFLKIWHAAPDYRASLSPPMAWMGLIVRSRALDQLRRRRPLEIVRPESPHESLESSAPSPEAGPESLCEASEQAWILRQCLERLPTAQRQALSMAYLGDLSHAELAQDLTRPLGTVKAWIRAGLKKLRLCMDAADRWSGDRRENRL